MKKISWATHKSLFGQIASSACLIGASAGIVFGVSAGTFKIRYFDLDKGEARVASCNVAQTNYTSQNIASQWNMYETLNPKGEVAVTGVEQPKSQTIDSTWWNEKHHGAIMLNKNDTTKKINPTIMGSMELKDKSPTWVASHKEAAEERMKYATLVIDGATHTAMDRSFNQGLYNGIANFTQNYDHDATSEGQAKVLKPAQDNTQEFVNVYRAAAAETSVLCLAGFNHVTPIKALGKQLGDGTFDYADPNINSTGMMLMDGDVSNNQNVASVLFRSDQPAFLTALSTCMYFYNNIDVYHAGYKDLAVGAYGGTAIPTVVIYMGGFQRGIEFFNEFVLRQVYLESMARSYMNDKTSSDSFFVKKLMPASKYKDEIKEISEMPVEKKAKIDAMIDLLYQEFSIKMIKLGGFGTHFSGSFASGDAIGISKQLLNRGASAIIAVAGPQSLDTAQEIMNQNKDCIVIGVDSAMERSDYQKPFKNAAFKDQDKASDGSASAQAGNIIKFSAVKDMTSVSDKMLRLAATGMNYDVKSTKPYLSRVVVPTVTKAEKTPVGDLKYASAGLGSYDIQGFDTDKVGKRELTIPLSRTVGEQTEYLGKISGFTAAQLADVEIIKFTGFLPEGRTIEILANAFTFPKEASKLKYIDFSNISVDQIAMPQAGNAFANLTFTGAGAEAKNNKGFIKLGSSKTLTQQESVYQYLLSDTDRTGYIHEEADPYKSVCAFGYKTCGNIENGLISISWDGWAPLIECLKNVKFYENLETTTSTDFYTAWQKFANAYCTAHSAELPEGYAAVATNPSDTNMITYDKDSKLNKGYSHTTMILGLVLGNYYLDFNANMTVKLDGSGHASQPSGKTRMSVLDWLKTNMYFIA